MNQQEKDERRVFVATRRKLAYDYAYDFMKKDGMAIREAGVLAAHKACELMCARLIVNDLLDQREKEEEER